MTNLKSSKHLDKCERIEELNAKIDAIMEGKVKVKNPEQMLAWLNNLLIKLETE